MISMRTDKAEKELLPYQKPGYTGKLRKTPLLPCQPNYQKEKMSQAERIDDAYQMFAAGTLDENGLNQLLGKIYATTDDNTTQGH